MTGKMSDDEKMRQAQEQLRELIREAHGTVKDARREMKEQIASLNEMKRETEFDLKRRVAEYFDGEVVRPEEVAASDLNVLQTAGELAKIMVLEATNELLKRMNEGRTNALEGSKGLLEIAQGHSNRIYEIEKMLGLYGRHDPGPPYRPPEDD